MRYLSYFLLALLGIWLLTSVTQVEPGERAVIRRFGRVLDDKPRPGLHIGLPWGIDRVDRVKIDTEQSVKIGFEAGAASDGNFIAPGQMLTGDHNLINLQIEVFYNIFEDQVVDYVVQKDRVESLLARAGESVMSEWVAGRTVDDVWGRKQLPGKGFVQQIQDRLDPYRLGIRVLQANVTQLAPPNEVRKEFEDVSRAKAEIETRRNEAQQEAKAKKDKAASSVYEIKLLTGAYANEQLLLAQAEADNFNKRRAQYRQLAEENPNYLNALWWDEMSKLYARMRQNGRIDLLDNHLSADGLDITQFPPLPRKK